MWYQSKSVHLHRELELLDIFDRVHEFSEGRAQRDAEAYSYRQQRRREIVDELAGLESRKWRIQGWRVGSAALVFSASTYVTLHYLLG